MELIIPNTCGIKGLFIFINNVHDHIAHEIRIEFNVLLDEARTCVQLNELLELIYHA